MAELFEGGHQIRVIFIAILNRLLPLDRLPISGYLMQDIHFVVGGFEIVLRTLLDFDRNVAVIFEIFRKPDSREMAPAQLLDDNVSVDENLAYMNWMVPA